MESFAGKLAVVTGGGTGMGRELVIQLAREGCSVATCDLNAENVTETKRRAHEGASSDVKITTHSCDVSDEAACSSFVLVIADTPLPHQPALHKAHGGGGASSPAIGVRGTETGHVTGAG